MLFNSAVFIFLFLPIVVGGFYFLLRQHQYRLINIWLIIASLFFYGYWNIKYVPLILFSVLFNYFMGKCISFCVSYRKKYLLFFAVAVNLCLLGYFKYADFLIDNVNLFVNSHFSHLNIVLPLAISFFTFQQIAYVVNCYQNNINGQGFLKYLLFVTFFPQLIAGPIVNYKEMVPQFEKYDEKKINYESIFRSLCLFWGGLFKKVIIADYFAFYATYGFDNAYSLTCDRAWAASLSYTLQIYFDFSGYCDMAMGIAGFFGIVLPLNFNAPYKSLNIQDFWRRWHITLSRFLLNYLYIPLGGSKKGEIRTIINIAVVFLLGGLWHGAAYTFVIWGGLHGAFLIIYRLWLKTGCHLNKFLAWFLTFNCVNIAWVFFRANNLKSAFRVLKAMFDFSSMTIMPLSGLMAIIVIGMTVYLPQCTDMVKKFSVKSLKSAYLWSIALTVLSCFVLKDVIIQPYTEFIYFNF